jgi:hypothetical protein
MRILEDTSTGWGIAGITYEAALRAVGQDLADLLFESLEIKIEDKTLVARGRCILHASKGIPKSTEGFARKAWNSLTGKGARENKEPLLEPFERKYSPEDINRLDELGKTQQSSAGKTPDLSSLAETLRTIGRAIDSKGGTLVRLSKGERSMTFVYEDASGRHTEDIYSLWLYKSQQEALSLRGKIKKPDIWEDSK